MNYKKSSEITIDGLNNGLKQEYTEHQKTIILTVVLGAMVGWFALLGYALNFMPQNALNSISFF